MSYSPPHDQIYISLSKHYYYAVSRVDNLPPAQPNGVVINYIEVEKETLTRPLLYNRGDQHIMVLSNYRVSYSVHDCGAGMGLLTGSYDDTNKTALRVTRVCNIL